ncbi:adenylate/guanylate cyclase domain-containing protein [Zavarzinia sp. CC-PAN008]|uniref:adenylate/guanylate cyclase domain-containing protein n=1 Tax=Zavarzinia sp. CC-PAN008 TaxID=3243332 RepID=UPI003F746DBC
MAEPHPEIKESPARTYGQDGFPAWLVDHGGNTHGIERLIAQVGEQLRAEGVPLWRVSSAVMAIHPELFARTFRWTDGQGVEVRGRARGAEALDDYVLSPVAAIHRGNPGFRYQLEQTTAPDPYPVLTDLRAEGATDYLIRPLDMTFGRRSFISWTTRAPGGFSDAQLARLEMVRPLLALRFDIEVRHEIAQTVLSLYLGANAGREVLAGSVRRGEGQSIRAALLCADMRNFTRLSDSQAAPTVIGLLDQYFECLTDAVERHGGEVLKLMGDGVLAIFPTGLAGDRAAARAALAAARSGLAQIAAIDTAQLDPAFDLRAGVGLHLGDVVYGNIGGPNRLDFTVIGPAVNAAARIEGLCKVLGHPVLASHTFADAHDGGLRSLGFHVLRGLREPEEVFTPDDAAAG